MVRRADRPGSDRGGLCRASGIHHVLTDAHNIYLNVAMHGGLLALAGILALIGFVARQLRSPPIAAALAFASLNAFAYQGLTGS